MKGIGFFPAKARPMKTRMMKARRTRASMDFTLCLIRKTLILIKANFLLQLLLILVAADHHPPEVDTSTNIKSSYPIVASAFDAELERGATDAVREICDRMMYIGSTFFRCRYHI